MKFTHLVKLTLLLAAVSLQLGCLKSPGNPEPSNFGSANPERLNLDPIGGSSTPYPASYSNGIPVKAADGRILLVKPGTWELISQPPARDVIATMASGERVIIRPDGTWSYFRRGPVSGAGTSVRPNRTGTKPPSPPPLPPPATVVFYQLGGDGGNGKATIFMDGNPVAALRAKRFFAIRVPPGQHIFTVSKASQNPRILNIAGGRTYYVRNKGGILNKEVLILDGADEGEAAVSKLKVINGVDVNRPDIMVEPRMSN